MAVGLKDSKDYLNEAQEQKKKRKSKLFIETQNIFDQNRPLVIAPEGTSETEDNLTPNSPGPLKPGAFLLADQLKPEPLLVPIALANFDYSISDTIYSAVIKKPIKIKDFVNDMKNKKELENFTKNIMKELQAADPVIEASRNIVLQDLRV